MFQRDSGIGGVGLIHSYYVLTVQKVRGVSAYVYGKQILAAAPGTVVTAIDGVPDNEPGSMNPLCAVGNCLIIDQGSKELTIHELSSLRLLGLYRTCRGLVFPESAFELGKKGEGIVAEDLPSNS